MLIEAYLIFQTIKEMIQKDINKIGRESGLNGFELVSYHYKNTPMHHTAIFHGCKNDNFQMKFFYIFLIFAQNIDCGYTLEPPQ